MEFMDSSALAVLLNTRKQLAGHHGRLVISGLSPALKTTFQVSGLDQLFRLEPSLDRALEGFDD